MSRLAERTRNKPLRLAATVSVAVALVACSKGDHPSADGTGVGPVPCSGFCQTDNPQRLEITDVERIIAQGVAEANARGKPATFVVTDRVGNVLAAYQMPGAPPRIDVTSGINERTGALISGGLDNVAIVPSELGSLAKALAAIYFSSEGNAFSSRTAGQIIQEHFNPGELNTPGGPLFGVQISQLPCSDVSRRFNGVGPDPGPHRSAIGFAADPGGLPLYKQGVTVGAVGVIADGVYGVDKIITDNDKTADPNGDIDELIATAATFGFAAPRDRRADVITLDGKTARFSDVDFGDLLTNPASAPAFDPSGLISIRGYANAAVQAGTRFGNADSGIRAADTITDSPGLAAADGFVVVDETNANRFPATAGAPIASGGLTQQEVERLLVKSVELANRTRSQVRRPLGSRAGIHLVVVDVNGDIVGAARTRDALVDAIDVNAQKARSALFFSKDTSAAELAAVPPAAYLNPGPPASASVLPDPVELRRVDIGTYVSDFRNFIGDPTALADGATAYSTRSIGNISRPFYPDDVDGNPPGPLSKPEGEWSIFSTGLELDLVYNAIIRHLAFVLGAAPTDVGIGCTGWAPITDILGGAPEQENPIPEIRNGITLFAGGFPIYRGNQLIGAIGLSGDGLEQDDFLPFLAIDEVGKELGPGSINNAPKAIRADQLDIGGVNLRYVICPQSPFLDSDVQNVCDGL
ncbi:MAG TPA: heme-binding protein [Nevskiaceae bacterium]|nr:heme-binding protein [Nevskiaceae bacterium]